MVLHYKNTPVFYEDDGRGDVVVLLHGFLENSSMWDNLKPIIKETHRVVTTDLLGHGQTGCLGYIHTMDDMANAVFTVLDHLKIKKFTLVGHSMGGYVALALAKKTPKSINGLCLMNSTYIADDIKRKAIRERANDMAKINFESVVRLSFTNLFSSESRITYKDEMEAALTIALQTSLQGYIAAQKGMSARFDAFEFFKTLKAKKLIIIGRKDPIIHYDRILEDIDGTDIVCEALAYGHMSHVENKSELSYIIKRFIE